MVFAYRAVLPDRPLVPAVPITLIGHNDVAAKVVALVDSGADYSCFPMPWSAPLGIDLSECERRPARTAASVMVRYVSPQPLRAMVGAHEIALEAAFGPTVFPLLGREDFFAMFQVTFDHDERVLTLRPRQQ